MATDVQPCPYRPFSTLTLHLQDDDPSLIISLVTVTVPRRTLLMAAGSSGRSTLTFLIASSTGVTVLAVSASSQCAVAQNAAARCHVDIRSTCVSASAR